MDQRILIGTSGYSYKDWNGVFYPEATRPEEMLSAYARRFSTVELNFSYYCQPEARQLEKMAEAVRGVNPQFTFAVKAHQSLTHKIGPDWRDEAARFREGVASLQGRAVLGAVLVQFPHSFHYTIQNRRHLDALLNRLDGLPCACEFRSPEWLRERVYEGLRSRQAALVAVDEPELEGLLPPVAVPTGEFAYVRFHGRNKDNWWRGDNASRYDYLYSDDELREWTPRIQALLQSVRHIFLYFNNHWRGQAPRNAEMLRLILESLAGER